MSSPTCRYQRSLRVLVDQRIALAGKLGQNLSQERIIKNRLRLGTLMKFHMEVTATTELSILKWAGGVQWCWLAIFGFIDSFYWYYNFSFFILISSWRCTGSYGNRNDLISSFSLPILYYILGKNPGGSIRCLRSISKHLCSLKKYSGIWT